jgi:hypothetical protein
MVLEANGKEPVFCLGAVLDSLPPQCGGPRLVGWDWDFIDNKETARGTTWGDAAITGHYREGTFDVVDAGIPDYPPFEDHPIETLCDDPDGGWQSEGDRDSDRDRDRALRYARSQPEHAGAWVDYLEEPAEFEDTPYVLNVAFTGDIERHESALRELWEGPLCVVSFERSLGELMDIQNELSGDVGKEMGLEVLTSAASENRNVVEISVVIATPEMLDALEKRYGPSVVEVDARLRPTE